MDNFWIVALLHAVSDMCTQQFISIRAYNFCSRPRAGYSSISRLAVYHFPVITIRAYNFCSRPRTGYSFVSRLAVYHFSFISIRVYNFCSRPSAGYTSVSRLTVYRFPCSSYLPSQLLCLRVNVTVVLGRLVSWRGGWASQWLPPHFHISTGTSPASYSVGTVGYSPEGWSGWEHVDNRSPTSSAVDLYLYFHVHLYKFQSETGNFVSLSVFKWTNLI